MSIIASMAKKNKNTNALHILYYIILLSCLIFPWRLFIIYIRSTLGHLSRKPCFDPRAEIPVEYSYCATCHIIWLRKTACMHVIKLYTWCTYILYFKTAFANFHCIPPPPAMIVYYYFCLLKF